VVRDRSEALEPVYEELLRRAAAARVLHNDDTRARILALMGKGRAQLLAKGALEQPERTGLFTTSVVAQTDEGTIVLFFTGRRHAGENLAELLKRRASELSPPIHMSDGLDHNLPKGHAVVHGNCLVHGRRHFVEQVNNFPDECRKVFEQVRAVYRTEAICEKNGLTPQQLPARAMGSAHLVSARARSAAGQQHL
jgi:transposase